MTQYLVTHATPDGPDYDRRIDYIGGPWASGPGGWMMHVEDAISGLKAERFELATKIPVNVLAPAGSIAAILAGHGPNGETPILVIPASLLGREHLATVANGIETDNLQSLPPCPATFVLVRSL